MPPLARRFFRRDPVAVARALLGKTLVRTLDASGRSTRLAGIIVETEAYLGPDDRAAHAYNRHRSPRNESMYADAGFAYVYFTYGMHFCFNVVAGRINHPVACLIRALVPTEGLDAMRRHRTRPRRRTALRDTDLCSGPAKLAQALAIDRSLDGIDLTADPRLHIEAGRRVDPATVVAAPRIGVHYAAEWADKPLRFYISGNPHVSVR